MKEIVITGALGFIGSHVYDRVRKEYPESIITIIDKMNYASRLSNIKDDVRTTIVKSNISDREVIDYYISKSDLVINMAAEQSVDLSFNSVQYFMQENCLATISLMDACRKYNKRLIHMSTDEVYGTVEDVAVTESGVLSPTNPYSASKAAAEMMISAYKKSYNMDISVIRSNNIIGIRQYPDNIFPIFIKRALNDKPLIIHGDGLYRRHYLPVSDFVEAMMLVINQASPDVYNIASNYELTVLEVAELIKKHFNKTVKTVNTPDPRPFNDRRYHIDDSKIRALGWSPTKSIDDLVGEMIKWYSNNFTEIDV